MLPTTSMFIARAFGRVSQGATSTLLPKELFGLGSMRAMSSSASSSALPRSSFQTRYSVDEDLSVSRIANEVDKELAEQIAMDIVRNKYTRQLSPSGYFDPSIPIVAKHPLGWMDPARVASPTELKATTILCVRKGNKVVMMGDGQVSLGSTVVKPNARKVRRLKDNIIAGFAGATADAFTLLERLEVKLEEHPGQLLRSCVELAKSWRTDKYLRTLEAIICVADKEISLTLTGNGDVLEPNDGLIGIGSGGLYALSAAKALIGIDNLTAEDIALRSMKIASEVCVYTNSNYTVEVLDI